MNKRVVVKNILWSLVAVGVVATVVRFRNGLGATTGLNDASPWGLWIGFDVMGGVALAAGGFVIAATVHIFKLEKFKPVARPAVLTAFLGYVAVAVGLLFDLGIPWHIYYPTFRWQHHSALFEVAWCVMLYLTVLAMEFAPVVLEHPLFSTEMFRTIGRVLKRSTLVLVTAAVTLSTLHQSSLGSLFLIMPERLHPLWYSPLLPVLFLVSAIGVGLAMVVVENLFSGWLYDHAPDPEMLAGLGKASAVVLWFYTVLRVGDLAFRGSLPRAFDGSWQAGLFFFEMAVLAVVPAALMSFGRVRANLWGTGTAAVLTICGLILNRLSTSIIVQTRPPGLTYFPSWIEFAVSFGIISAAALVFMFCVEHLRVMEGKPQADADAADPYTKPAFDPVTRVIVRPVAVQFDTSRTVLGVTAAAAAVALLSPSALHGYRIPPTPTHSARGHRPMIIDGNRAKESVPFPHEDHIKRYHGDRSCVRCHHLNKPKDTCTSCYECHADMYLATSIFNHDEHIAQLGDAASCDRCHGPSRGKSTAVACNAPGCHADYVPRKGKTRFEYHARSYVEAMHGKCVKCHDKEANRVNKPRLGQCPTCHKPPPGRTK